MAAVKRQNLTISSKLEIIRRVERGEKKSDVAAAYSIPRSTLSTILKNKADIRAKADKRPAATTSARRVRTAAFEDVEAAVYKWFVDVRSQNIPVSGPMIEQKAKDFAFMLNRHDFRGGSGWLQRFKERHGIVGRAVTGESRAVDLGSVQKWIDENWNDIKTRYHPRDIFNADETALFWQMLPNRTLACRDDKSHGGKVNKARISVLLATNVDGSTKLRPLVIGKSKSPRCLKNALSVPVSYRSNGKAWMTSELFGKWLKSWDDDLVSQGRKVCLLVDNCSAHHCNVSVSNIELRFLPPNTTSVLQPLDQGVIRALKAGYRKRLVQRLLLNLRTGRELKIDLLGAITMLNASWNDVKQETIQNCFRHCGLSASGEAGASSSNNHHEPLDSGEPLEELDELFSQLAEFPGAVCDGTAATDFVSVDDDVPTTGELADEDIIADLTRDAAGDSNCQDTTSSYPPSCSDALNALSVVRRHCESIEGCGLSCSQSLDNVEKCMLNNAFKIKKQKKINDYFSH
ncbi:tigger transposable element-derived protein 6-like [Dermacentor albipictus]|uniref:tigger transposable element-derived protein 6-like n=1 Tax=Dermacentor albipictus TaxID=60249 RepID=UPI0031FBD2A9